MPLVFVTLRDGETREVQSTVGMSVMMNIRDAGVEELAALCGGCLSCATCHVYVDEAFREQLPAMSRDEDELLSNLEHRAKGSRLSCQIPMNDTLSGLRVTVAPEE